MFRNVNGEHRPTQHNLPTVDVHYGASGNSLVAKSKRSRDIVSINVEPQAGRGACSASGEFKSPPSATGRHFCRVCLEARPYASKILEHMRSHGAFACKECGELFESSARKTAHHCKHKCLSSRCFPENSAVGNDVNLHRHDRQESCPHPFAVPQEERMVYWWAKFSKFDSQSQSVSRTQRQGRSAKEDTHVRVIQEDLGTSKEENRVFEEEDHTLKEILREPHGENKYQENNIATYQMRQAHCHDFSVPQNLITPTKSAVESKRRSAWLSSPTPCDSNTDVPPCNPAPRERQSESSDPPNYHGAYFANSHFVASPQSYHSQDVNQFAHGVQQVPNPATAVFEPLQRSFITDSSHSYYMDNAPHSTAAGVPELQLANERSAPHEQQRSAAPQFLDDPQSNQASTPSTLTREPHHHLDYFPPVQSYSLPTEPQQPQQAEGQAHSSQVFWQ